MAERVLPASVSIVEVGPRDGLQNEPESLSVESKVAFIEALAAAGHTRIEAAAFVHPDRVPQMADAEKVIAAASKRVSAPVRLSALVPNRKGLERALAAGVREVAVVSSCTESFNRRNLNASIDESLAEIDAIVSAARPQGVPVRAYLSVAFVCPYEGRVPVEVVRDYATRLLDAGAFEVAISDTIGAATPGEVGTLLALLPAEVAAGTIALHFHDTRGTALANVAEALGHGVRVFDASAGGLGGCPFAPGALGNLATEDLLYLLQGMGIEADASLDGVMRASRRLESALGRRLPARVLQAGGSPRPA